MEETNESPASISAQAKRDAELEELRQRNLASTTKDQLNLDGSSQPITKEAFLELQKQQTLLTKQKQAEAQNLLKEYRNKDLNIKQTDEYKLKQQEAQNMLHSYRGDTDSLTSYQVKKISKKDNYVPNVGSSGQLQTMNEKTDDDDDFFASLDNEFMPSPAKDENGTENKPQDAQNVDAPAEVSDDDKIDNFNSLSFGQDDIIKKPSESSNENSTESWVDVNTQEKSKVEEKSTDDVNTDDADEEVEGNEEPSVKDQEESTGNVEQQENKSTKDEVKDDEEQMQMKEKEAVRLKAEEEERLRNEAEIEEARLAEIEKAEAEEEAERIAEEERIKAEQEAEAARIVEEQRIAKEEEAARIAAEAARIAVEERIKAEQEAESARIAEEQRVAAEAEAEAARWSDKCVSVSFSYLTDYELSSGSEIIKSTIEEIKRIVPESLNVYTTSGEIQIANTTYDISVSRDGE